MIFSNFVDIIKELLKYLEGTSLKQLLSRKWYFTKTQRFPLSFRKCWNLFKVIVIASTCLVLWVD